MNPREINKAIANHGYWKVRLQDAIESGKSEWTPEQANNDKLCEFGQWFHSLPTLDKNSSHWKRIEPLHSQFHSFAGTILKMALDGRTDEAISIISDVNGEFVTTSIALTTALHEWKKEVIENSEKLDSSSLSE